MTQIKTNLTSYSEHHPEKGVKDNWAAEYAKREVDNHREAEVLDHPDGCVTVEKLSDGVREMISEAVGVVQSVTETANNAKDIADAAKTSADIAVSEAENAYDKSLDADSKADDAVLISNTAKVKSETAEQRAISAETKADAAVASASGAVQKAEDVQSDFEEHGNNTDIHTTAEEKLVASEAYDLAREAKGIAISADSVAEKSLQYWQPNTTYRAGQAVYVTTYSGDYIYKCIVGHTSGDTFSETIDSVKVWQFTGEVTAGFAVRADVAVRAEYDVDGDGIAKAAHLDLKADKATITTSDDTALSFEFSAFYNTDIRTSELTNLSFTFGNGEYAQDYISGISFDSGATPTAIDYTDSGILNWVGTDCATSDGLSIFQPSTNTHYDIVFYFNGTQFIGLVNGYVPATGNEAV